MPDFNQKKPGEQLTNVSASEREKLISRNMYKGNAKYLSVYDENTGGSVDILGNGESNTGRNGNLKTNLYGRANEYSSGNLDTGTGYSPTVTEPR